MTPETTGLPTRRHFLLATGAITATTLAGGFALGMPMAAEAIDATAAPTSANPAAAGSAVRAGAAALTDWVRITSDDVVTLVVSQAEMGQGISTSLPAVLADELGADWSRVRLELAPTALPYRNPRAHWQFTGNSESTQSFFVLMRRVGATARAMLAGAAARRWDVPVDALTVADGRVTHAASGRSASFGELAVDAAKIAPPESPALRPDRELKLVGRPLPRIDQVAKADGSAQFGIDYLPPGLRDVAFAAIRTAPAYGARPLQVRNLDAVKARRGVIDVVMLPSAVAVVAGRYWQARAALAAADIEFDAGPHADLDSAALAGLYADRLEHGPFRTAKDVAAPAEAAQARVVTRRYELGFQSHATMEPMNALASVTPDGCRIWAPTQGQELAKFGVAAALKIAPDQVSVERSPYLGGGFGRRLLPDFCIDAALLSKAVGRPVKVIWSREEDFRRDWFRPAVMSELGARVDDQGRPLDLQVKVVSPTILKPVFPRVDLSTGIDPSCLEGTLESRYRIPGWRTQFHLLDIPVPTSVYRTTGHGPNIFALESFVDELAHASHADPYRFRRGLLAHDPRALRVLDEVARRAGWDHPMPRGHGRGIAFTDAFGTVLAQVVEVEVGPPAGPGGGQRTVKVQRIVTVADPGRVIDPRISEAGLEGGAIFGLSSITQGEITFARGGPVQTNFHEYGMVRLAQAPRFETWLLESPGEALGGVGEVGPVATVPAFANAVFAACGQRLRSFPLARHGFVLA